MYSATNIEKQLQKYRNKRLGKETVMDEVLCIFSENDIQRDKISATLTKKHKTVSNEFNFNYLKTENIYQLEDIKNICITYRLRFLDSHYFHGNFPEEAISKIRQLEKVHKTTLQHFKIIAPAKRLKLENADDPMLFAPMGNDYFYFIHKWGNDLHPLRKILMWPYKNFENLVFTVFLLSILITAITPLSWFTKTGGMQEEIILFLFIFKMVGGIVLYYGFAKGKNFNGAIWDSKYYNA